jgi:hypothetical protein
VRWVGAPSFLGVLANWEAAFVKEQPVRNEGKSCDQNNLDDAYAIGGRGSAPYAGNCF